MTLAYITGAICWLGLFGGLAYAALSDKHR